MSNQDIITLEDSLVKQNGTNLWVKTKQQIMTEITQALNDKWMDSKYIVDKLSYIIDKAYIINNNWDLMPDFKTMLKWVEMLLKLSWVDVDTKIKVAIFNNIPPPWEKLNY